MKKVIERILIGESVIINGQKYYKVQLEADKVHARGEKHYDKKQYEKALEFFEKEIELDPEGNIGYEYKGLTLMKMGRREEGIKNLEIAVHKAGNYYELSGRLMDKEVFEELKKELTTAREDANTA